MLNMTAIMEAKQMYAKLGLDFERDLGYYLTNGHVISMPDKFIMFKSIDSAKGDDDWNPANPDTWYVHMAVGKGALRWFLEQAPVKLPLLAWRRLKNFPKNPLRFYPFAQFSRFV